MSGLNLNAAKCVFFTAGISTRTVETIKHFTGFNLGCLPVRYLGVPLVTRKLSEKDCENLIENIKSRLTLWSGKHLSFAGRLELIRAVLFSIANYWCRQLLLPQSVINKIEQLCSRFFWKGTDKAATGARERDRLWVAWIKTYVLKEKDFWHIEGGPNFSWSFNRILKLRPEALPALSNRTLNIRDIWQEIRMNGDKVSWHLLIWFPLHISKHNIIACMALLDRLPTHDRLQRMGITTTVNCVLCNAAMETRTHLFFECPTASNLWEAILLHNGLKKSISSWEDMIVWACNTWKGKSLISTILKLAWCARFYVLWEERNRRIFQGSSRSAEELFICIKEFVGIKLRGKT